MVENVLVKNFGINFVSDIDLSAEVVLMSSFGKRDILTVKK